MSDKRDEFDGALWRIVYLAGAGCLLIVGFGFSQKQGAFFAVTCTALIAGWAALVAGGLLGFLFGVPHTRDGGPAPKQTVNPLSGGLRPEKASSNAPDTYRPNTSLEQVSDWLTKIIVGVGLVQFRSILARLAALTAYLAKGFGDGGQGQAFAAGLLVFFTVCGFIFGFLWARLFLPKWFGQADEWRDLKEEVSTLQKRLQADGNAMALVIHSLNRTENDDPMVQSDVDQTIKSASRSVRAQIFDAVHEALNKQDDLDYPFKLQGVIALLRALIGADPDETYHRNHADLSSALDRLRPPKNEDALREISKAIEIRDKHKLQGWKYYEFHRARCAFKASNNSPDPSTTESIVVDLRVAKTDVDGWARWYTPQSNIAKWIAAKGIDLDGPGTGVTNPNAAPASAPGS